MGLKDRIKREISFFLNTPGEELGRWARFLRYQIQLWILCARRLREKNVLAMSSALSFRTLFAMVPTLVLTMIVLKSVGVFQSRPVVHWALDKAGLTKITIVQPTPTTSTTAPATIPTQLNLADQIEALVEKVERKLTLGAIGPIGMLLLIWSALTLMMTMERSLNRVFEAPRGRSLWQRIGLYWTALTLGPVLIVAADYGGEKILAVAPDASAIAWLLVAIGWAEPVVIGILVLAALYKIVPSRDIPFTAALAGAVVAGPLWLIAKWAFSLYVVEFVTKGNLYGALGLIPLFLVWLNLSWWIFLFGASLAHSAIRLRRNQPETS